MLPDGNTTNHRGLIVTLAAHHWLPAVYPFRYFAASGGLLSYGTDVADVFRRAASYVEPHPQRHQSVPTSESGADQVRTGDQPQGRQEARLAIPPTLLAGADEVIE